MLVYCMFLDQQLRSSSSWVNWQSAETVVIFQAVSNFLTVWIFGRPVFVILLRYFRQQSA